MDAPHPGVIGTVPPKGENPEVPRVDDREHGFPRARPVRCPVAVPTLGMNSLRLGRNVKVTADVQDLHSQR